MRSQMMAAAAVLGPLLAISTGLAQQDIPPAKVVGRETCKTCHESEHAAWMSSSHNTKAWRLLDEPKAVEFAKAMGVANVKGASLCTKCHGTQQEKGGQLTVAQGNSCESCHGGAGGDGGWLNHHFDYGLGRGADSKIADLLQDRTKETKENQAKRDAACKLAGMNRSEDAFELAQNCLQCHLVPDEKLVAAGHPMSSRFEFVEWAQGEVRHNFLLNASVNAEVPTNWMDSHRNGPGRNADSRKRLMFVAGQLADLTVSLRNRSIASSTKRGSLGGEANGRIVGIQRDLKKLKIAELAPVLAAIEKMSRRSLRAVKDNDQQVYGDAAAAVAKAAKALVAKHRDGSQLPADVEIPDKAKGSPHKG